TLGVVGAELHDAARVADRVLVPVELGRVFRHTLIALAGALRVRPREALEHGDRLVELALEAEHAFEAREALQIRRSRREAALQRALGLRIAAEANLRLGEQAAGLEIRRIPPQPAIERRRLG